MTESQSHDDVTPETLMNHFHGPGFSKMLFVTIAVHLLLILGTSIPFLLSAFGGGKADLSQDERVANAVSDARASLEAIAEKHGLSPQELSDQFGSKKSRATATAASEPTPAPSAVEPSSPESEKSAIEKELDVTKPGPDLPAIPPVDEEDLFGDE